MIDRLAVRHMLYMDALPLIENKINELVDGYNKLHEGYKEIHKKLDPLMTVIHDDRTVDWRFLGDFEALYAQTQIETK